MTTTAPTSPPLGAFDHRRPTRPDRPLLRADDFADDGHEGTGPRPSVLEDFWVDWQLVVGAQR